MILAFEIGGLTKWVTGPNFVLVLSGPSSPPDCMNLALTVIRALSVPVLLGFVYRYLIRPWRRESFIDYVRGQGADRAGPGPDPAVLAPAPGAGYLDTSGHLLYPPGANPPQLITFKTEN